MGINACDCTCDCPACNICQPSEPVAIESTKHKPSPDERSWTAIETALNRIHRALESIELAMSELEKL
jgi:hypothetical protein